MTLPDAVLTFRPPRPIDVPRTLGLLRRGAHDPTMRIDRCEVWRATRTPDGPATVRLTWSADAVTASAWGAGAARACEDAPALVGVGDDPSGFVPRHPVVAELARRFADVPVPRTGSVFEALVPSICEQKVQAVSAYRSYAAIVRRWGEPAPGPLAGLRVPPSPAVLAAQPSWAFHDLAVERKRADTIVLASRHARRLDEAATLPNDQAAARLTALPGIGPWTAAQVSFVALGDPDAVSVGDFHLPNQVSWALAGEARGDDERMLELLEPYRGHRGRVLRLLTLGGLHAPRFGPRLPLRSIAAI